MTEAPDHDLPTGTGSPKAWETLGDSLPMPADSADREDLLWQELTAQFRWYDKAATRSRLSYQVLKIATLVIGASVTVLAAVGAAAAVTASLAATVVVIEGIQQVFQFHPNWISYRATAETLRQHAFLYAANIDPYGDPQTRRERLGEIIRDLTTKENTSWANTMRPTTTAPVA